MKELSYDGKRQKAEGRRQKGKDLQVKVSAFGVVLIALAIAIDSKHIS
ncbi:MAG: hypothetical protein F6J96_01540 [Symploca sp. SIO1C2]|nr:hypothetical protein [Symploca sp. SIO1C2]